jgi:hypothetical protein
MVILKMPQVTPALFVSPLDWQLTNLEWRVIGLYPSIKYNNGYNCSHLTEIDISVNVIQMMGGPESCVDFLANWNLQSFLTSLCKSHMNQRERIYFLARVYLTEQNVHQMDQIHQFVDSDRQFLLTDNRSCNVSLDILNVQTHIPHFITN